MKKSCVFSLILIMLVLVCGIYFVGHSIYTRQICPLWDIKDKICYSCDYPNLVQVDPSVLNHCPQRQLHEDCCKNGKYQSVPKDFVDKDHFLDCEYRANHVWDDCWAFSKQLSIFNNSHIIIILLFVLTLIFFIFRKTRWIAFCTFSSVGTITFAEKICYFVMNDRVNQYSPRLSDYIGLVGISAIIAVLPFVINLIWYIKKQVSRKTFLKNMLIWLVIPCISLFLFAPLLSVLF